MTYDNDHKKNFNSKKKPFVKQPLGNKVIVVDGNFDFALRKFKKKIQNSGLMDDIRKKEFFEKPTSARKMKKAMAIKREKKRQSLELRPARRPGNRW